MVKTDTNKHSASPSTTLVILLGASEWPSAPGFGSSAAFANSAAAVKAYFLQPDGFSLPHSNLLDLFDADETADDIDQKIGEFLDQRQADIKRTGSEVRDLIVYYTGHGGFIRPNNDFCLAIRRTREASLHVSSIPVTTLANTLKEKARRLRRVLILDCCYAAAAFRVFQAQGPSAVAIEKAIDAFEVGVQGHGIPTKGTSLLCLSGHHTESLLMPDASGTMFSTALMYALKRGNPNMDTLLTLEAVEQLTADALSELSLADAPRIELHSPDQSEGKVDRVPLFPNSGNRPIVAGAPERPSSDAKAVQVHAPTAHGFAQLQEGEAPADAEALGEHDSAGFDAFTEGARNALNLAQEEALRFNHNYIGTEHLLLGLIREEDEVAAKVLAHFGLELNKIRSSVEFLIGHADHAVLGDIGLTPRAKKVIELAVDEARRLNHHYIGTEHLLLGLVREGEGIAAGVLESLGVNLEKARTQTIQVLGPDVRKVRNHPETPTLDQMGIDITAQVWAGELDPIIGREKEIDRVIQILSTSQKCDPALVSEPGIGKTMIVEGLAQRIVSGEVPDTLEGMRIVALDMSALMTDIASGSEFSERLKKIIEEIRSSQDCIIFIDEVHTLVGAGSTEAAKIFKSALSRGQFQCIGTTTLDEYRKYIEKDAALDRRFRKVIVRESTVEETIQILKGKRDTIEQHHRLIITDDALKAAAEMGSRYITDRFLPDKAIDLIDEAASRVRMQRSLAPLNLKEAMRGLEAVLREKDEAIQNQDYEQAAELRDREVKLRDRIAKLESGWHKDQGTEKPTVGEEDIAQIVSMWTGIPVMRIAQEESARLLEMEGALHKRVIGQEEAIETISRAVRRARAGLKDPKRPIGSFIFMGPTGVGKTELAKTLAEFMFGSEDALIKIDMSEFMERHAAARLVGAPPGYVGYEEGGQLTEAVRRKSYSVILLDEIEKAHPDVFNMLLQILEDGKLTDAKGRTVDFRNTIIIMTSNVGASLLNKEAAIGFMQGKDKAKQAQSEYEAMKDKVLGELKNTFKPEFLNRIDAIIVFHSLRQEHVREIVDLMLNRVRAQLTEQQVELLVPDDAKDYLVTKGYDPQYGARPLRRTIQNLVEDPLAEGLLQGKFRPGDIIEGVVREGAFVLEVHERRDDLLKQLPPPPEAALPAGGDGGEATR